MPTNTINKLNVDRNAIITIISILGGLIIIFYIGSLFV